MLVASTPARADVSSWLSVMGGAGSLSRPDVDDATHRAMQLGLGIGTSPERAVVVGPMLKATTYFDLGTDLSLSLRAATGGFVRGGFGLAIDAGGFERYWGDGTSGFGGALVLGAPWGIQASVDWSRGTDTSRAMAAFVGLDLLRLTVYRTSGTTWMPNPYPATPVGDEPPTR